MELPVGPVIYKLRKEKGVTQESLANAVGVSVAAVSKWESKNSYPDITILPSIARFFNTTIDKLLSYEIEISNEEVMELMKECATLFEKDSVENAMKACEDYIKQYPNNIFLKFRVGSLYMMSIASATSEEEGNMILNKAIGLLEISAKSDEQEIMETSKYILSSLYTMNNQEDKAEAVLLSLPKVNMDRDDMLVGLYINQEKIDDAKKMLRNLTYKRISNIVISLDYYFSIALKEENTTKAKEILEIQDKIVKAVDLEGIYGTSSSMMFSNVYAKEKNVEKTLDYIEKMLESAKKDYNLEGNLLFDEIELINGVHSRGYFIANLKKVISEDRYDFVKDERRYKEVLEKIDSLI